MKKFIKENLVLFIGLTLPLLLVLLFFVATVIPKSMATPPQHEMLFSITKYEYENSPEYSLDFMVKDARLVVKVKKNDDKTKNHNSKKLMAYDGKTETVREIVLDAAKVAALANSGEMILRETKNMTLDVSNLSPDGYTLEGPNYVGNGLVGGLFGGGSYSNGYRIKKDSFAYKLPNTQPDSYYSEVKFIGWVVRKQ